MVETAGAVEHPGNANPYLRFRRLGNGTDHIEVNEVDEIRRLRTS